MVPQKAETLGLQALTLCPAVTFPVIPPWLLKKPVIDLALLELKNQEEFSKETVEYHIRAQYKDKLVFFTDASKAPDGKVGVAFVVPELKMCKKERISNDLAVYTAELVAILTALTWIEGNRPRGGVLIA